MKLNFNCDPLSGSLLAEPLVFTWDSDTGEVSGPDAELVRKMAGWETVAAHPLPWSWKLGPDPLRSWEDMAAIVGSEWALPPELLKHYPPAPERGDPPTDDDGNPLPGLCY